MARYEVSVIYDGEFRRVQISPSTIDYLRPGDIIYFNNDGFASDLRVLNYDVDDWLTNDSVVGAGEYLHRKNSGEGKTDYVTIRTNGYTTSLKTITRAKDTYPDSFSFGDASNLNPKGLYSKSVTISGINAPTPVSVSSSLNAGLALMENGKIKRIQNAVENGDVVTVYYNAPDDYDKSDTINVHIGSRSDAFTVRTKKWPEPEQVINFDNSLPISLKDAGDFYGYKGSHPRLTDYYRGGGLVPSIQQNAHIPTSGRIKLSDLEDSASALYFIYKPPSQRDMKNTLDDAQTIALAWDFIDDYMVGYGNTAKDIEYRYTVSRDDGLPDFKLISKSGSPGSWSEDNTWVSVRATCPRNTERAYRGTLHIHVKNKYDSSLYITANVSYDLIFYGP